MSSRAIRTALDWSGREFGIVSAVGNATYNSNAIPIDGCNQISLEFTIVNVTGAAITTTCYPEVKRHADTVWTSLLTKAIAAGVETCSIRQIVLPATAAAAGTYRYSYDTSIAGMDAEEFRLATIVMNGSGATDLLTITCRVGHSGT